MNQANALSQYKSIGVQSGMVDATPHQMITKLLDGALDRIAAARGAIQRGEVKRRGELLGRAIAIIDSMRASLDHERGGEISTNLASLYDYMERRLLDAGRSSDESALEEVSGLLREIKAGWSAIPAELQKS